MAHPARVARPVRRHAERRGGAGAVHGNRLDLRFRMAGGFAVEQRLYLRPDGRVALNRLTVRKLGIVVAVLDETITKVG